MREAAAAAPTAQGQAAKAEARPRPRPQEGLLLLPRRGFVAQVPPRAVLPEDQEEGAEVRALLIAQVPSQLLACYCAIIWHTHTHALLIDRSQTEEEEGNDNAVESTEDGQERSDCTVCTDQPADVDGEVNQDGHGSSSNGRGEDRDDLAMVYEKDGEMERVLEKQAELIGQFEAQENAQREWEEKFSLSRDSVMVHTFLFQI
jgi:hypothetical protein